MRTKRIGFIADSNEYSYLQEGLQLPNSSNLIYPFPSQILSWQVLFVIFMVDGGSYSRADMTLAVVVRYVVWSLEHWTVIFFYAVDRAGVEI